MYSAPPLETGDRAGRARYKESVNRPDPVDRDQPELVVLVPEPPWRRGALDGPDAARLVFEVRETREGVAELALTVSDAPLERRAVLALLAAAGMPALGDTARGGLPVAGGPRLAAPAERPASWWPETAPWPTEGLPSFRVSKGTARALERGHPWVLPDADSDDAGAYRPGTLVGLRCGRRALGLARIEGRGRVAARVWDREVRRPREAASPEARVARALDRRKGLLAPKPGAPPTDAFRLVHGEADGLPGLFIDRLGPLLRVLITGRACELVQGRVLAGVTSRLVDALGPDPPLVFVTHLRERPAGRLECVRARGGKLPPSPRADGRIAVRERGLTFWVDPGLAEPERSSPGVGLYLDQRDNRGRLAACVRRTGGGRWLNLFAHTGAFSVALLHAGADEVVSVDLSGAYLRWLDENLAANGLSGASHRGVRRDGRRYLEELAPGERFDGIVIDPPTAAAAGRRFWSAGRGLEPLLAQAFARLSPGGSLFVSRNERGARGRLDALVRRAADGAGVEIDAVRDAPPGEDFPRLSHFPEGAPFRAVLVRRA